MTEGELQKRIHATRKYRGGYMAMKRIAPIIDEAKNDFPTSGIGDSHENAVINGMHKTQQWFKKWFGDST